MDSLLNDFTSGLLDSVQPPCLSLYQPTIRTHPDKQQNLIRFRNLLSALEESLRREHSTRDIRPLLEPFERLAANSVFWATETRDGLAVLAAPDFFRVYHFQRAVPELAIVASSFHVKPLLRQLQSADGYYVLSLDRQKIRLFEGNRDRLDEVALATDVPQTITDVAGEADQQQNLSTWTPARAAGGPGSGGGVFYGEGTEAHAGDAATDRFFRAVDRAVLEHYSRPSGQPLLLVAGEENQSHFRRLSHNPSLLADGITIDPNALSLDELRERAWRAMEPHYLARLARLIENFDTARAHARGDADLAQAGRNAVAGRVETLLIDADHRVPGQLDATTGEISYADLADPHVDDVLDDLAQLVLKQRGEVVVVPTERMPTDTGIAAIYRF